jgi:hypothetical protein
MPEMRFDAGLIPRKIKLSTGQISSYPQVDMSGLRGFEGLIS